MKKIIFVVVVIIIGFLGFRKELFVKPETKFKLVKKDLFNYQNDPKENSGAYILLNIQNISV